jgi:hypothetical protein
MTPYFKQQLGIDQGTEQDMITRCEREHGRPVVSHPAQGALQAMTPERQQVESRLPPAMVHALNQIREAATLQAMGTHGGAKPEAQEGQN